MSTPADKRQRKAFPLRIDAAVWEAVARLAASELRSTNAQIEVLLRESLLRRGVRPAVREIPDGDQTG